MAPRWARSIAAGLGLLAAGWLGPALADVWPGSSWPTASPASQGVDPGKLADALAYGNRHGGAGMVVRHGYLVGSWGNIHAIGAMSSASKAWGSLITGLAIDDRLLTQDTKAEQIFPDFGALPRSNPPAWRQQVTIHELLTMTAGFGSNSPAYPPLKFQPGTVWFYSNGSANWLADTVLLAYGRDLRDVFEQRILDPIGARDFNWRFDVYRTKELDGLPRREFASGMGASVDTQARVGLLMLRHGNWEGRQLISQAYVADATRPQADVARTRLDDSCAGQNGRYGLLWFTNVDGKMRGVPRDAFFQWGAHDVFTLVVPSLDLVASRQGHALGNGCYEILQPLMDLIVGAVH